MGGKSDTPPVPDYTGLAKSQSQEQQQLLQQQTTANRPDTTTPYGSTAWTYDPAKQTWSGSQTLNPALQDTLNTQEQAGQQTAGTQLTAAQEGNSLFNTDLANGQFNPVDYSGAPKVQSGNYYNTNAQNAVWDQFQGMEKPLMDQQTQQQQAQLEGQGLKPGDAAYDTAMKNLSNTQYQQTQSAQDQAVLAGQQEAQTMQGMDVQANQNYVNNTNLQQNQNMNILNSVLGHGTSPNFGTSQIGANAAGLASAPDLTGAASQGYGGALNSTNASNAANGNLWSGLGSAAMAAGMFFSDSRLKKDLKKIGYTKSGLPVYEYRYTWEESGEKHTGVLAQDAEKMFPDAVKTVSGVKLVDYSRIS